MGRLQEATITLSLKDFEDSRFAAIAKPPLGTECIAPHDIDGTISFEQTSYDVYHAFDRVLYLGHETTGTMSCGMIDNTTAQMRLLPDQGKQEVSCLSGLLLVCISADESKEAFDMAISVQASFSEGGLFKGCRKGRHATLRITNKPFELSLRSKYKSYSFS